SRTTPAFSSTCRCLVTACLVTPLPVVSATIDIGPPADNDATRKSRVSSPSAANTGAALHARAAAPLRRGFDVAADRFHLLRPAFIVAPICVAAAGCRHRVESRLDD